MTTSIRPGAAARRRALRIAVAIMLVLGLVGGSYITDVGPFGSGDAAVLPPSDAPDPSGPGPYAVGRTTFTVTDPERGDRQLTTDVWYPSDAGAVSDVPMSEFDLQLAALPSPKAHDNPPVSRSSPRGLPLVVFSHGLQTIRFQSYDLMEFLASHGYVVAAPDHTGNTIFEAMSRTAVSIPETLRDRPQDVSAVIDDMLERNATPGDLFEGRVDRDRIAASGNSTGGWTALVMRTGYRDAAENTDVAPDPRIKATVAISPFFGFFDEGDVPPLEGPAMIIGGTSDAIAPVKRDSKRAFDLLPSSQRFRVDIHGAAHGSFSNVCDFMSAFDGAAEPVPADLTDFVSKLADMSCADDLRPPAEVQRITNRYTLAFLNWVLDDDDRYEKYLTWDAAHRFPIDYYRGDKP